MLNLDANPRHVGACSALQRMSLERKVQLTDQKRREEEYTNSNEERSNGDDRERRSRPPAPALIPRALHVVAWLFTEILKVH